MFNRIIVFIVVILSVYTINADGNRIISNEDNIVKAVSSALNSIGVNYDYNKKGYKITHLGSSNKSQVQDNKILFDCEIASCILESDSLNIISIALKNNIQRERSSTDNKSLINKAISISNIFLCCKKTTVSNFICEESDESLVSDDGYGAFVVNADVKYNSYDYSGCFTVIFDKKGNLTDVNIPIIFYISVKNKINISSEDAINIAIKDASIKYNNTILSNNIKNKIIISDISTIVSNISRKIPVYIWEVKLTPEKTDDGRLIYNIDAENGKILSVDSFEKQDKDELESSNIKDYKNIVTDPDKLDDKFIDKMIMISEKINEKELIKFKENNPNAVINMRKHLKEAKQKWDKSMDAQNRDIPENEDKKQ